MSFIQESDLKKLEERYGKPLELKTTINMSPSEMDIVRNSQKDGRAHDVTLFILNGERLLFNAKHFYPDGLYRAPSGGVKPGESIEEGARREAFEETGVEIKFERYLAKVNVRFLNREHEDEFIDWTSYVFKAKYISGEIKPRDTHEIREARFVMAEEIPAFTEIMKNSERGGFHYRAFLTENIMPLITEVK